MKDRVTIRLTRSVAAYLSSCGNVSQYVNGLLRDRMNLVREAVSKIEKSQLTPAHAIYVVLEGQDVGQLAHDIRVDARLIDALVGEFNGPNGAWVRELIGKPSRAKALTPASSRPPPPPRPSKRSGKRRVVEVIQRRRPTSVGGGGR